MKFHTHTQAKRKKIKDDTGFKPNCFIEMLQLHASSVFFVTSSEVQARLMFNAFKQQKLAKFPRAELNSLETEIYLLN